MQFPKRKAVHSTLGDAVLGAALRKGMTWSSTAAALITLCSRHFRQKMLTPHNGTTAIARTRVLPQATPVGTLSAQFATSILAAGYVRFPAKIGIGGRLATPPLPHHRAYGSRTTAAELGLGGRIDLGKS